LCVLYELGIVIGRWIKPLGSEDEGNESRQAGQT
jgi:Sec-independent protein secretion pathway component TatC